MTIVMMIIKNISTTFDLCNINANNLHKYVCVKLYNYIHVTETKVKL